MSALHSISEQIRKMRPQDWLALAKLGLAFLPGKVWKLVSPHMWVVSEYRHLARDNGYWMFRHIRLCHPEQQVYYPIERNAPDYCAVSPLGNVIPFGGFRHYLLFWAADVQIGTTKCYGFPYRRICEDLVQWNIHQFKYVFLNHGYTRGKSSIVDASETNYDLLLTCSDDDRRVIIEENGQLPEHVRTTGYARHDNLTNELLDSKRILVMPTWRKWIDYRLLTNKADLERNEQLFLDSPYYLCWQAFLNDARLITLLEERDLNLVFYLHEYAQGYSHHFSSRSERVTIATTDRYNIQDLLKTSALLVTDYSSVCYDFGYMHRPVIYYQFDREEFERRQYAPGGFFSYEKNGFGEVALTQDEVLDFVSASAANEFVMEEKYAERVDDYFAYRDQHNCERVYDAICTL